MNSRKDLLLSIPLSKMTRNYKKKKALSRTSCSLVLDHWTVVPFTT